MCIANVSILYNKTLLSLLEILSCLFRGDLVYLALLNLEKQKRIEKYFDLETDIHSWISGHWCRLKPGQVKSRNYVKKYVTTDTLV